MEGTSRTAQCFYVLLISRESTFRWRTFSAAPQTRTNVYFVSRAIVAKSIGQIPIVRRKEVKCLAPTYPGTIANNKEHGMRSQLHRCTSSVLHCLRMDAKGLTADVTVLSSGVSSTSVIRLSRVAGLVSGKLRPTGLSAFASHHIVTLKS